ncbi:conserved hypothetical protein [Methanocella paludicola SANAE]|uniref:UPF0305 protein MCP_1795 n=1 Tax=Methanocella paludicola (strain DSM 17711 / JCM 13418 / NBRC 101707 / SANAE) TaxID=304371 RepID=D1YZJ5_METPS|nr:DUF2115 domain-containing protein [Methanocella paludicola]BAI61867.1 conserved hypothetical protein [Methanocella paludicola SANAE]
MSLNKAGEYMAIVMEQVYPSGRARAVFSRIKNIKKKCELGEALAFELGRLSILDLQAMSAFLEYEINKLPSPYRESIHPYFTEQLFGSYFKLMRMHGDGSLKKIPGEIEDQKTFLEYCAMITGGEDGHLEESYYGGYYHLVSCFTIFVMDEPGHPVGMPFPGGFRVERRPEGFYCPIRDKEKDVLFSICNFCPAKQSELP